MIKRLTIKNFQVHKKLELEFTAGLNVLTGETGRGKSAVIRALRLLLENQPRGGDKKYHRAKSKMPLEIQLEDNSGNVISRKKKKYTLNKSTFKAFGSEVPEPIRNIFPLKEINWHRQLDPHFLILSSAGNAAKILGASTGLEEQEFIVKEIKDRLSTCKSEIKRLTLAGEEAREKVKKLRPVVKHLMVARSIKTKEDILDQLKEDMEELQNIIDQLQDCDKKINKYNISDLLHKTSEILRLMVILEEKAAELKDLIDIVEKLQEDGAISEEKLNKFIKNIKTILNKMDELQEDESYHKSIQTILEQIKTNDKKIVENEQKIKDKQMEYDKLLVKFKTCPFCKSKIKGD